MVNVALALGLTAVVLSGLWYLVAYIRFREALADTGVAPEYGIRESLNPALRMPTDVIDLPGIGPVGGLQRQVKMWWLTSHRSEEPSVEAWRVRMSRRLLIGICLLYFGMAGTLLSGFLLEYLVTASRGTAIGYVLVALGVAALAYAIARLAALVVRYGNARRTRPLDFLLRLATLVVAWLFIYGELMIAPLLVR